MLGEINATVWLQNYLQGKGPVDNETVRRDAKAAGFTRGEIQAAKIACDVKLETRIFWSIPEGDYDA